MKRRPLPFTMAWVLAALFAWLLAVAPAPASARAGRNVTSPVTASHTGFDAFGKRYGTAYTDPFGFQAQWGAYTDRSSASDTGLVLTGYRYYDPTTGRFLTRDPVGYAGGINLYAYCRNNPVNLADPLGLCNDGTEVEDPDKETDWMIDRLQFVQLDLFPDLVDTGSKLVALMGRVPSTGGVRPPNTRWTSPEGLVYESGGKEGNRFLHLAQHLTDDPSKAVHSVFNVPDSSHLVPLVDEAWRMRGVPLANDPMAYVVDMGRVIGTRGETAIRIVVKSPGSNVLKTAYPVFL